WAIRTRPKVNSGLPVRKYGLCSLIDAMSAKSEPTSSQNRAEVAKNSTGPRQEAWIPPRSAADRSRSVRFIAAGTAISLSLLSFTGVARRLAGEGVGRFTDGFVRAEDRQRPLLEVVELAASERPPESQHRRPAEDDDGADHGGQDDGVNGAHG